MVADHEAAAITPEEVPPAAEEVPTILGTEPESPVLDSGFDPEDPTLITPETKDSE